MTILRTIATLTITAASLSALVGCSGDSHDAAQQASTVSSSSSSSSSSPATSSSKSSTTSAATTTTPAPVASASTRTTRTVAPTTARPRTTTPAKSYTCQYEEGTAPCTYAEYLENKEAYASYEASNNGGAVSSSTTVPGTGLDANGFALGGPAQPEGPNDYEHPSTADCARFARELHAWADYQNTHRPAGYNGLPTSGELQYLGTVYHMDYYG